MFALCIANGQTAWIINELKVRQIKLTEINKLFLKSFLITLEVEQ